MPEILSNSFGPLLVLTGNIDKDIMLPLMIEVRLDVGSLKFDGVGNLVKGEASFEASYDARRLKGVDWDRMVGDEAVLEGIEGHLAAMGYMGGLLWRPFDMQRPGLLKLWMRPALVTSIFPDAVMYAVRNR